MGLFSTVSAAYLEGRQIKVLHLFMFDWNDGDVAPKRFFTGQGKITAGGEIWYGMGKFVRVSDLKVAMKGEAPKTTFTFSGADEELLMATAEAADAVRNQPCYAYFQYYDADQTTWTPLDDPILFWTNTMKAVTFTDEYQTSSIELETEGPLYRRHRPINSQWNDRDQQNRYPDDRGAENIPLLVNVTIDWPFFDPP